MTQEAIEKNSGKRKRGTAIAEDTAEELDTLEEEYEGEDDDENGVGNITERKGRATPGKRSRQEASEQSGNFLVRWFRGIRGYLSGVQEELDKVVWPTREELFRLGRIILVVTIITSIILGIMSFVFSELFILGFENNLVFLAFFIGIGLLYFVVTRAFKNQDNPPSF